MPCRKRCSLPAASKTVCPVQGSRHDTSHRLGLRRRPTASFDCTGCKDLRCHTVGGVDAMFFRATQPGICYLLDGRFSQRSFRDRKDRLDLRGVQFGRASTLHRPLRADVQKQLPGARTVALRISAVAGMLPAIDAGRPSINQQNLMPMAGLVPRSSSHSAAQPRRKPCHRQACAPPCSAG